MPFQLHIRNFEGNPFKLIVAMTLPPYKMKYTAYNLFLITQGHFDIFDNFSLS